MPAIHGYAFRITCWTFTGSRRINRGVDAQRAVAVLVLSFCGFSEGWIRPNIYSVALIVPIRCVVDFGELWQGAVEFAPGLLETDLQRIDIDRIEAGRATAAYAYECIRDRRG